MKKKKLIKELRLVNLAYNKQTHLLVMADAEKKVSEINEKALISCENANKELHEKLECYRVVLRDMF